MKVLKSKKLKEEGGRSNSSLGFVSCYLGSSFFSFLGSAAFLGFCYSFLGFSCFSGFKFTHSFLVTKGFLKMLATGSKERMWLYHLKMATFPFKKFWSITVYIKGAMTQTKEVSATVNYSPAK